MKWWLLSLRIELVAWCIVHAIWVNAQEPAASSEALPAPIRKVINEYCAACHDASSDQPLFASLSEWSETGTGLSDPQVRQHWEQIADRVARGDMPPPEASPLSNDDRRSFLETLDEQLIRQITAERRVHGRTPVRRMTRGEFERTVQDLLHISLPLQGLLPEESREGGFDRVARGLRFSPLHIEQCLSAADAAIDEAINLGPEPSTEPRRFPYRNEQGIRTNLTSDRPIVRDLGDAAVIFTDAPYITRLHDYHFEQPGLYRFRIRAKGFQTQRPVVLRFHIGNWSKGTTRLVGFWDVTPAEYQTFEVVARVEANEYCYPAPDRLLPPDQQSHIWNTAAENYRGEGLAIEWIEVEGPLHETWPPRSTQRLLGERVTIEKRDQERWINGRRIAYSVHSDAPHQDSKQAIRALAADAFRRPITDADIEPFVRMAHAALDQGATYEDAMRRAARAMLVSPQFLLHHESPGALDDHALANRLSYFIWGTAPDSQLRRLADEGRLNDSLVFRQETERLLDDPRSQVMINSVADQWLDVGRIDATTPDSRLYPEFDELLKQSMIQETHAFLSELVARDLPIRELIDSRFVMINRRLAEHYDLPVSFGQEIRAVELPENSIRGGVLTQGAILKVTANGTVSSPVTRGVWVMTRLLGTPPPPPPASVGAIEPDTRGATTISQQLDAHRNLPACASCHRSIDPLGFPLECFDVIGGTRQRYRSTAQGDRPETLLNGRPIWEYKLGPNVDVATQMEDGVEVESVTELKEWLLARERMIASQAVRQWMTYATGAEMNRADRIELETILDQTQADGYRMRQIIHAVVQNRLFREK